MTRGFIAAVLAVALAITGASAVQARADSDDLVGALIGLAFIAALASAIDDDNDSNDSRTVRRHDRGYHTGHGHGRRAGVLPRRCDRIFETRRGDRRGYGLRCLDRHAAHLHLPRACLREGFTDRGRRAFYGKRCLRREGYRVAGRGR